MNSRLAIAGLILLLAGGWLTWRRQPGAPAPEEAPRTRHLRPDGGPRYTNRLTRERSPYLRQHAHNPVDWYPWGEEAFAKARAERKPVLLSVGYSTCHWCHVMEEESFEDEEIAAYLNDRYVAVKVDREERPDVDRVYMNAVQLMNDGGGGWPMTVWLTPERRPFYAGTYFPPRSGVRGERVGFLELLRKLAETYATEPARVETAAADVVARLEAAAAPPPAAGAPGIDTLGRAWAAIGPSFDEKHGGFGGRPKFPRPSQLLFLLRYHRRAGDPAPLRMTVRTLDAMASGGIHDQAGGGFHRYSVDAAWRMPHFEKMLYDNALLAIVYLEASQATGRADLADVARDILEYLGRDMAAPGGGFCAASDADSEGEEGKFFLWTAAELAEALGPARGAAAAAYFDVGGEPTTLATPRPDPKPAGLHDLRRDLRAARSRRVAPHVDRKVVVSWNSLAISAFARASRILGDPAFAAAARSAATAVVDARRDGRLPRYLIDGVPHGSGYVDDYAFLIAGLLDLFEATFEVRWLRDAVALQRVQDSRFADPAGGYFQTADDHEALLTREKPDYDGAEPTGNSVALQNLVRLHALTTDDRYRQRAAALLNAFATPLARAPSALPHMLAGLDMAAGPTKEVILVSPAGAAALAPFLDHLARTFHPSHVLAVATDGAARTELTALVPIAANKPPIDGRPTAYVCQSHICKRPTTDVTVFAEQLAQ